MLEPIEAALLDVDGTLIDSNDSHAHSWVDAFAAFGIESAFEQVRPLIGMGGDRILTLWGIDKDSDRGRAITTVRGQIFRDYYLPALKPFPFVRALLERLKADGVKLVVATSAGKDEIKAILERAGVADLIDEITTSADVNVSKPAPDVLNVALERAGKSAAQVVFVGDTPYDVEAGHRAGIKVVALRCGGWSDADLTGAAAIYDDASELLAHYATSILCVPRRRPRRSSFFGHKGAA